MSRSILYSINESGTPLGIGYSTKVFGQLSLEELGVYYFIVLKNLPGPSTRSEIYEVSQETSAHVDKIIDSLIQKKWIKEEVVS